jgi:hypothetical protein
MYPYLEQLLAYRAGDPARRVGALVLEVKGDFCAHVHAILARHGRAGDYVEISLTSVYRYNPLHNDLDAYALAYGIATLMTNLFGRGKEPFWQQASTNLVKFVILLHQVLEDYVTPFQVVRARHQSGQAAGPQRSRSDTSTTSPRETSDMTFDIILPFLRPIAPLILDPTVSEVMVNPSGRVFVERTGVLEEVPEVGVDERNLQVAVKIAPTLGDDISEERPILDARLPDGSRVAAVFPPRSLGGTTLTIRKFQTRLFTAEELVRSGTMPAAVLLRLRAAMGGGTTS